MDPQPNPYAAPVPAAAPPPKREFHTSELGLKAMFLAIASGDGFGRPRTVGGIWFAIGVVSLLWNLFLIVGTGHYFLYLAMITPLALLTGGFLLFTGEPLDRGYPAPKWSRVGLGICFFGGIALGLLLTIALHE